MNISLQIKIVSMEFLEAFKTRYKQYYKRTEITTIINRDIIDAATKANRRRTQTNILSQVVSNINKYSLVMIKIWKQKKTRKKGIYSSPRIMNFILKFLFLHLLNRLIFLRMLTSLVQRFETRLFNFSPVSLPGKRNRPAVPDEH